MFQNCSRMTQNFTFFLQKSSSSDSETGPPLEMKPKVFYKGKPLCHRTGDVLAQIAAHENKTVELEETPPKRKTRGASKKH